MRARPLYEQVYVELRNRISDGHLAPGAWLDVNDLADLLGVSRTPVREAVRQLIQEGLAIPDRDGHVFVYEAGVVGLAETYAIRVALESLAVRLAVRRGVDTHPLREAIAAAEDAESSDDWSGVADANSRFHEALLSQSENQSLIRLLDTLQVGVRAYRKSAMRSPERRAAAHSAHHDLVHLIERGDADGASTRITNELLEAGAHAVGSYEIDPSHDTPSMSYLRGAQQRSSSGGSGAAT